MFENISSMDTSPALPIASPISRSQRATVVDVLSIIHTAYRAHMGFIARFLCLLVIAAALCLMLALVVDIPRGVAAPSQGSTVPISTTTGVVSQVWRVSKQGDAPVYYVMLSGHIGMVYRVDDSDGGNLHRGEKVQVWYRAGTDIVMVTMVLPLN